MVGWWSSGQEGSLCPVVMWTIWSSISQVILSAIYWSTSLHALETPSVGPGWSCPNSADHDHLHLLTHCSSKSYCGRSLKTLLVSLTPWMLLQKMLFPIGGWTAMLWCHGSLESKWLGFSTRQCTWECISPFFSVLIMQTNSWLSSCNTWSSTKS